MHPLLAPRAAARPVARTASRLAWLDAIRGLAAFCVVVDHATYHVLVPVRHFLYHWLDFGQYGVFVFFLVSGYIIPASLERKGSVRSFWIGRAFRLYPPYLLALALSVAGFEAGLIRLHGVQHDWPVTLSSWVLMTPNLMGGANIPNVTWTLSYEMVFYLAVAALFSLGAHRFSGSCALACGIVALAVGAALPMDLFAHGTGRELAANLTGDIVILGGVALAVRGRDVAAALGGCAAALGGLALLTVNQHYPYPWTGLTILAFMFAGTLVYRAEQGQVGRVRATLTGAAVLGLTLATGLWDGSRPHAGWGTSGAAWRYQWVTSLVLAAATFGIGMLVRHRRIPRLLAWLGVISYSVYLFHPLVLDGLGVAGLLRGHSLAGQLAVLALIIAAVTAVSAASYYLLEKPMQGLGRRLARQWEARSAPVAT